jgi:5-methylcytosine-specific restriction endonuclease McrA
MEHPLTTSASCQVHAQHVPRSHINHVHHVWPLADGGPNTEANRAVICPTGHYNVHSLIDVYRKRAPTPGELLRYTRHEKALAWLGWQRILNRTMTGSVAEVLASMGA